MKITFAYAKISIAAVAALLFAAPVFAANPIPASPAHDPWVQVHWVCTAGGDTINLYSDTPGSGPIASFPCDSNLSSPGGARTVTFQEMDGVSDPGCLAGESDTDALLIPGCVVDQGTYTWNQDCGNGTIDSGNGEICDDANASPGDGCDDLCQVEAGYSCTGEPSACSNLPPPPTLNFTPAATGFGSAAGDVKNFFIWLTLHVLGAVMIVGGVYAGLTAIGRRFGLLKTTPDGGAAGERVARLRADRIVSRREGMKPGDMWSVKK